MTKRIDFYSTQYLYDGNSYLVIINQTHRGLEFGTEMCREHLPYPASMFQATNGVELVSCGFPDTSTLTKDKKLRVYTQGAENQHDSRKIKLSATDLLRVTEAISEYNSFFAASNHPESQTEWLSKRIARRVKFIGVSVKKIGRNINLLRQEMGEVNKFDYKQVVNPHLDAMEQVTPRVRRQISDGVFGLQTKRPSKLRRLVRACRCVEE